ncbi:hypothetical protein [Paenibacillus sp. CAA11]|uniref:hypothetical protein n=1 Tax=Paenibacillus sp. CAA11 TaxID=1532905 RepID=UPI0026A558CE
MLYSFLLTIYKVFLPISLPVVGGALLKRFKNVDNRPLSALSLYVLSPALIFETLLKARIEAEDVMQTVLFCLCNLVVMWGIAVAAGRWPLA